MMRESYRRHALLRRNFQYLLATMSMMAGQATAAEFGTVVDGSNAGFDERLVPILERIARLGPEPESTKFRKLRQGTGDSICGEADRMTPEGFRSGFVPFLFDVSSQRTDFMPSPAVPSFQEWIARAEVKCP